jgi:hypothetical protein
MDFLPFWLRCKKVKQSRLTPAQAGSGRRHNHSNTAAMQLQATMRTHMGVGVSHKMAAHPAIMAAALRLALRLTKPPACQFCSMGPNKACCQSQWCMRGELRMAAQPAIKMNTVVGKPGTKIPTTPKHRHSTAKARSNQRMYQRLSMAGAGAVVGAVEISGLAGKDMLRLCLRRKRRVPCKRF